MPPSAKESEQSACLVPDSGGISRRVLGIEFRPPVASALGSALATAVAAWPIGRWLAESGSLDIPNHRSSHSAPVPRGGGIAALLGTVAAAAMSQATLSPKRAASIVTLAGVGWADDMTGHVSARLRLVAQAGVGALGLSRDVGDRPMGSLVTAGVVNVVNFMDGINGISALTGLVWGVNAMLLEDESGGDLTNLGALTAGASLGFLPHNLPKARLFLGDVGSYALGGAMAAGILSQRTPRNRYLAAAPLLLYGVDVGQALLRRALAGERIGEAHRRHIYQQLVDAGRSHSAVATTHALGALMVAAASRRHPTVAVPVTAAVVLAYLRLPTAKLSARTHAAPEAES